MELKWQGSGSIWNRISWSNDFWMVFPSWVWNRFLVLILKLMMLPKCFKKGIWLESCATGILEQWIIWWAAETKARILKELDESAIGYGGWVTGDAGSIEHWPIERTVGAALAEQLRAFEFLISRTTPVLTQRKQREQSALRYLCVLLFKSTINSGRIYFSVSEGFQASTFDQLEVNPCFLLNRTEAREGHKVWPLGHQLMECSNCWMLRRDPNISIECWGATPAISHCSFQKGSG